MVDGFVTARRSDDGEVDGRLYFYEGEDLKRMKIKDYISRDLKPQSMSRILHSPKKD